MKRILLIVLLVAAGCAAKKDPTPAASPAAPASTAPAKKMIHSGDPEFAAMLAALKADPKTTKFAREIVEFKMTVDSVKEVNKQTYQVKGKGDGVNLVVTFLLPPNLAVNDRARELAAGDKLTYLGEPTEYAPGDPATITTLSGSVLKIERAKP
jgi:hypothetical protein